jgi:hypothetical protein
LPARIAADLLTKLKLLFIVVISLFGAVSALHSCFFALLSRAMRICCFHLQMNLGAALGFYLDARDKKIVAARLHDPACGYRVADDGAWLWRFGLEPLPDVLAPPSGPAVQLALVLGLPFARLRAALPDEFFVTHLGAALGHRHGFSASAMASTADLRHELLTHRIQPAATSRIHAGATARLTTKLSQSDVAASASMSHLASPTRALALSAMLAAESTPPESPNAEQLTDAPPPLEEFIGTALVLAFLQVTQLMPVLEISRHRAAAAAHFEGTTSPAGWSFDDTATKCITLLSPGVVSTRDKYWCVALRHLDCCFRH